ncbi:uncharacterized protein LOC100843214 [Brachypodium distachyon]|uniref:DUF4408 domain-containing protein n=1 Tax=Brachypodium distachyon TaxID=15368 RepID=I1GSZ5_BRADI|nr:uncharacterized protein LOC100843214 [Brachypodium distachyon]KQK15514.1 hypothetical protein BRADI_1g23390v3 [Brachypodium distachyon]|eukprot:XP_010236359.1 uncharacterized protein LOC100843214 [Brachypodium distachyon]
MEQKQIVRTFSALGQLAKIAAMLLLFLIVPFVSPSLKGPYLYLVFNALVVSLGVQAGIISVSVSVPSNQNKSPSASNLTNPGETADHVTNSDHRHLVSGGTKQRAPLLLVERREVNKLAHRAAIKEGVVGVAKKLTEKINNCPSRASIFFIRSVDADYAGEVVEASSLTVHQVAEERKEWKADDAGVRLSKQELFTNAEAFIGNFYKQLKMQRDESCVGD